MKTGISHLPLHYGKAPSWLFKRMQHLAREITIAIIEEWGAEEMLHRLSDPFWFQAFGCTLGFDWHSSGLTTTVCSALKEGLKEIENELGLYIAGGKGAASRKTPSQIEDYCTHLSLDPQRLVYASKMCAKVDNAAVQDGYQLYHHTFFFTRSGSWAVVQQGMNTEHHYARRYHWISEEVKSFVCEPHHAICCDFTGKTLNLVAQESAPCREVSTLLAREKPEKLTAEVTKVQELVLPQRHDIKLSDIDSTRFKKVMNQIYEHQPEDYEALLSIEGVGPKTLRTLSLLSELLYGAKPSFRDPARFSFSHGGKDGHPYPVDRQAYDFSIEFLRTYLNRAKIEHGEKKEAFRKLSQL